MVVGHGFSMFNDYYDQLRKVKTNLFDIDKGSVVCSEFRKGAFPLIATVCLQHRDQLRGAHFRSHEAKYKRDAFIIKILNTDMFIENKNLQIHTPHQTRAISTLNFSLTN